MTTLLQRLPRFALFLGCSFAIAGCGDNQEPEQADALWQRIHDEGYRSFERAPGYASRKPSDTAHSDHVDIYINDVVSEALKADPPPNAYPVGSLIVKDGFDDDGVLQLVAVMDKRDDGWFWAEYTDVEDGDAKYSGKPDICIDCHSGGTDLVWAFTLGG